MTWAKARTSPGIDLEIGEGLQYRSVTDVMGVETVIFLKNGELVAGSIEGNPPVPEFLNSQTRKVLPSEHC